MKNSIVRLLCKALLLASALALVACANGPKTAF